MKLNIEELAVYLPHELNVWVNHNENGPYWCIYKLINIDFLDKRALVIGKDGRWNFKHQDYQPILRPLSDFNNAPEGFYKEFSTYLDCFVPLGMYAYYRNIEKFSLITWPYDLVKIFIKYHFDVYGLIEKKLAVNINTIDFNDYDK